MRRLRVAVQSKWMASPLPPPLDKKTFLSKNGPAVHTVAFEVSFALPQLTIGGELVVHLFTVEETCLCCLTCVSLVQIYAVNLS